MLGRPQCFDYFYYVDRLLCSVFDLLSPGTFGPRFTRTFDPENNLSVDF